MTHALLRTYQANPVTKTRVQSITIQKAMQT